MRKSLRLQLMMGVTDALKRISPENGYTTELNGAVFRGRRIYDDDTAPIPMISLIEDGEAAEMNRRGGGTETVSSLYLSIQGFVYAEGENPTDAAHELMFDAQRAIMDELEKRGGQGPMQEINLFGLGRAVRAIEIGSGVVLPVDEEGYSSYPWFYLPVKIEFVDDYA